MRELGARAVWAREVDACGGRAIWVHAGARGSIAFIVFIIVVFCFLVINKKERKKLIYPPIFTALLDRSGINFFFT